MLWKGAYGAIPIKENTGLHRNILVRMKMRTGDFKPMTARKPFTLLMLPRYGK
jgi:hypothetical protein